eukprot:812943-Prorocentrum_minimum.AAC.2
MLLQSRRGYPHIAQLYAPPIYTGGLGTQSNTTFHSKASACYRGRVVEELLAKRALSRLGNLVVRGERAAQCAGGHAHLPGEVAAAGKVLHHAAPDVVLAVPLNFLGGFAAGVATIPAG